MHKDFQAVRWKCIHDGTYVEVGERVLFLATCSHNTVFRFGTYIGMIANKKGYKPQVRYTTKKWVWNNATKSGEYVDCEKVSTLTLGQIIGVGSFKQSSYSNNVM